MAMMIQVNAQGRVGQEAMQTSHLGSEAAKKQGKQTKGSVKNIFAGNLNWNEDLITKKRKEAQQKAMKIIKGAWSSDQAIEQSIQERADRYDQMQKRQAEAIEVVKKLEEDKTALREEYGVDADAKEQKDLELLEKMQNIQAGVDGGNFTKEEKERLKELVKEPLTEYQKAALELNGQQIKFKTDMRDAEKEMKRASGEIRGIQLEKLKHEPMVAAQKTAEEILKAASDEIIGMLREQTVEQINEKMEEEVEKAKEKAEQKEEKEEHQEAIQEKRAIQEAMAAKTEEAAEKVEAIKKKREMPDVSVEETLNLTQTTVQTQDVQKLLKDIKSSMKMLEADLKGIQIDKGV